jgi:hypothetical protein
MALTLRMPLHGSPRCADIPKASLYPQKHDTSGMELGRDEYHNISPQRWKMKYEDGSYGDSVAVYISCKVGHLLAVSCPT